MPDNRKSTKENPESGTQYDSSKPQKMVKLAAARYCIGVSYNYNNQELEKLGSMWKKCFQSTIAQ